MMTCKYQAFTRRIHALAWVPGALALAALLVGGCSKNEAQVEEASAEPSLPSPQEYMKDPVFREKLASERHQREAILAQRMKLVRELEVKAKAMQEKMPGASEVEVVAELEKDPEWNSLVKRVEDLATASDESRAQSLKIVRERLAKPATLSK